MPESIKVECPNCSSHLLLPAKQLGKQIKCPKCGHEFKTTMRHAIVAKDSALSDKWTCPSCFRVFLIDVGGDEGLCPDCAQRSIAEGKRRGDALHEVEREVDDLSREFKQVKSRNLAKSANAVRTWSSVMAGLGVLSLIGGAFLAMVVDRETSIGQTLAVMYLVAGIVEAIFAFALAAGLAAVGNICEQLDES